MAKVHYATGVSLAMKNLKGVLVGAEKRRFHDIGLHQAIIDLNHTIQPALNIVDFTTCMERMGPKGGDLIKLNLIVAGADSAAVDWVGSSLMGYQIAEVKYLQEYTEMHRMKFSDIKVRGAEIEAVRVNLQKVNLAEAVPPQFRIFAKDVCSSCMNAFLMSCQFLEAEVREPVSVFIGGAGADLKEGDARALAFGNCALKRAAGGIGIRGCPPFPPELNRKLAEESFFEISK